MNLDSLRLKLYSLSFIEGGIVMLVELCAAKLLAPYFGTSIQVWAATIGVTMLGLATGYFLGSSISKKEIRNISNYLFGILSLASALILLLSVISDNILIFFLQFDLGLGTTLALMTFLFPILVLLGSTSPMIINLVNSPKENAGQTAGRIYGISTLGGILFTFLTGFYFLSNFGIKTTLIFGSCLLFIFNLINARAINKLFLAVVSVFIVFLTVLGASSGTVYNNKFKVIEESDGILGNIKVVEHAADWYGQKDKTGRGLLVNNTLQTFIDVNNPENSSIWSWSNMIPTILSILPEGSSALLCGLGGGTIAKQLKNLDFSFEVVEIDQRIERLAKQYFYLDEDVTVNIDDARHFIRTSDVKYDAIIFDTFLSESAPEQLLTYEAFLDAKSRLTPKGIILINFYGFLHGELGFAARSIYHTMEEAGLYVDLIATPGKEEHRNLFIVAGIQKLDFGNADYDEYGNDKIVDIRKFIISGDSFQRLDFEILYDNYPKISKLYSKAARSWKKAYNEYYTKQLIE